MAASSSTNRPSNLCRALGLMSGTSLDGIDVAALESDGEAHVATGPALTVSYPGDFRERLRGVLGGAGPVAAVEDELTRRHAAAIAEFRRRHPEITAELIGFHGHTILHEPENRRTWQIGDGALLARLTGCDVVADFRGADVAAGGEGAPLAPLYHAALASELPKPLAVLNLGGVGNVTWIGPGGKNGEDILAFDTGPGNAMLDDWVRRHSGRSADIGGALARAGRVSPAHVARFLAAPYFARVPPKSLDRDAFAAFVPDGLSPAVAAARPHFPLPAREFLVSGGGRRNPALMGALSRLLGVPLRPVEAVGWDGDALEAQAFAYLAIRSRRGLPLSLPTTTGAPRPMPGGRFFTAPI